MTSKSSERVLVLDDFGLTVALSENGAALHVTPASRITPDARRYIQQHKASLLDQLQDPDTFHQVGDLTAGIVTALATGRPMPAAPLPADLMERVDTITALEQWATADRAEWLGMLRAQIERDGVPVAELVATLDAHLARHHAGVEADDDREAIEERAAIMEHDGGLARAEAERRAGQVNDCMRCSHWKGEATIPDNRQHALQLVNPGHSYRGNTIIGACAKRYRPWRVSNLASEANYLRWHFIGQCAYQPARTQEQAA